MTTDKAFRIDQGELRSPVRTPQGFLRVDGYVSRAGIYAYADPKYDGGVRYELRPLEEVSREDALAGFEGAPLTARHPSSMITATNVRAYEVGTATSRARMDGNRVAASMVVKDPGTIAKVESGELAELSPGYAIREDHTPGRDARYASPGNPTGRYDLIQRDIVINHLALVEGARGGSDLRVRMDGADVAIEMRADNDLSAGSRNQLSGEDFAVPETRKLPIENAAHVRDAMSRFAQTEFPSSAARRTAYRKIIAAAHKFGIETTGFEQAHRNDSAEAPQERWDAMSGMTPEEQIRALKLQIDETNKTAAQRKDALDAVNAERDAANGKIKTLEERVATLETQLAAGASAMETEAIAKHGARADAAETKLAELESRREQDIARAAEVRVKAMAIMGPEFRVDGMSDRAVRSVVIKRFAPKEDLEKATDAYLATRFDSLVDARMRNAMSLTHASEVLAPIVPREQRNDARQQPLDTKEGRAKAWREQSLTRPADFRQKD